VNEVLRPNDSFVFQRVTVGIRKPIVRFQFSSGRKVELLGFHLEPAWASGGENPRSCIDQLVARLYPNENPLILGDIDNHPGAAFLCVAHFYSDTAVTGSSTGNYSILLFCALVSDIGRTVRTIAGEILAQVDWDAHATNDVMW
jgi:hypothetical protein